MEAFASGAAGTSSDADIDAAAAASVRDLDAVLRMEYRTKLLNPRWQEAMIAQGSGGAFEISSRLTALLGWGATSGFADAFVYDGAYDSFVGDDAVAAALRAANPAAFTNIAKRLLEAHGRGLWAAAAQEKIDKLRALYAELDEQLEQGAGARRSQ